MIGVGDAFYDGGREESASIDQGDGFGREGLRWAS